MTRISKTLLTFHTTDPEAAVLDWLQGTLQAYMDDFANDTPDAFIGTRIIPAFHSEIMRYPVVEVRCWKTGSPYPPHPDDLEKIRPDQAPPFGHICTALWAELRAFIPSRKVKCRRVELCVGGDLDIEGVDLLVEHLQAMVQTRFKPAEIAPVGDAKYGGSFERYRWRDNPNVENDKIVSDPDRLTLADKLAAVLEWDNMDRATRPQLVVWLEQRYGTNADLSPRVDIQTFHGWRRRYKKTNTKLIAT